MRSSRIGAIATALAVAAMAADPASAPAAAKHDNRTVQGVLDPDNSESDNSGHGAVLCSWSIVLTIQDIGQKCFSQRDHAFQRSLSDAIFRIDKFIMENAPVTQEQINARKASIHAQDMSNESLCKGDGVEIYKKIRDVGVAELQRGIDDLLSVPRKPVMNPCL